jgi:hypothetical protein
MWHTHVGAHDGVPLLLPRYGSGIFTSRNLFPGVPISAERDNLTFGDYQTWVEAPLTTCAPQTLCLALLNLISMRGCFHLISGFEF